MKTVNLGNIKYIFQIPLDWFKRAHNACFNSFGEDFIVVDHQDDGTNKIGINEQDFASKVEQYAGGKVKTVDGHEPDESGDVSFGLVTNKVVVTDGAGHLTTTDVEYATKDYVDYEDSVILEKVDTAVKVANSAGKVAGEAKASAAAAETTASAASAAAATADLHAGQAATDAERAWNRAGEVEGKADAAQTTADNAQSAANNAQATADAAQTAALDAAEVATDALAKAIDAEELADAADTTANEAKTIAQSAFSPTNKPTHTDISDWDTATDDFIKASSKPTSERYVAMLGTQLTPIEPASSGTTLLAYYNGNIVGAALGSANGVITIDNGTLNTSATRPKAFIATSANNEVGSLTSSSGGYPMFNASGVPQVQTFEPNKLVMTGSNGLLGTGTLPNDGFLYNNNGDIAARVFGTTAGTVAEGNHTHSNYATTGALAAVDTKATQANTAATQAKSRADEAYQFATDNFTYITQVQQTASAAQTAATQAQTTANEAQTTANEAQTTANEAQTAATQAQTTANEAQTTAQDAMDVAEDAAAATALCYSPANPPYTSDIADWSDVTEKFVTTDTAQTISGAKKFTDTVLVSSSSAKYFNVANTQSGNSAWLGAGQLYLNSSTNSNLYFRNNANTIQGAVRCTNGQGLILDGTGADKVTLQYQPTDESTESKAVATVGYVQSKFAKLTDDETPEEDDRSGSVGVSDKAARADHVHPIETPTSAASYVQMINAGEGTAPADTRSWSAGSSGLRISMQTRTFYDHTQSQPVLYGYYRTFDYNEFGRLVSVSQETRYEIDTPVVFDQE